MSKYIINIPSARREHHRRRPGEGRERGSRCESMQVQVVTDQNPTVANNHGCSLPLIRSHHPQGEQSERSRGQQFPAEDMVFETTGHKEEHACGQKRSTDHEKRDAHKGFSA